LSSETNAMTDKQEGGRKRNRLLVVLLVAAIVMLFAYAIQVTNVNLEEPLEPKRQENLVGLLRTLAHPDIFTFEDQTRSTDISIHMPCPEDVKASQVLEDGRQLLLAPNCVSTTQDLVSLTGEGFAENVRGVIQWYPLDSQTTRQVAEFRTDSQGSFAADFTFPDVRESETPQRLEVLELLTRRISGFSDTTRETVSRIIETVLMALMASTIGTILAIPISFLGARNIMRAVTMPMASIMAALIAAPIGGLVALMIGRWLSDLSALLTEIVLVGIGILLIAAILAFTALRFRAASPKSEDGESLGPQLARATRTAVIILLGFLAIGILANYGYMAGDWMRESLGPFNFVGTFVFVVSDFIRVTLAIMIAALGALLAAAYASRYAQEAVLRMAESSAKLFTTVLTALGTAILVFLLAYVANWICLFGLCRQLPDETSALLLTLAVPAAVIGFVAALLSLRTVPKHPIGIGMITYSITRTILNGLRAIEPVIMGFVLVVWVGIGPFAGILALMVSSVADLGKLFSEQVENIDEGPLEAVTATGAGRLQTIAFAVVPQIVPHYIAFIFYRWDINVRLSTIIGFVGGGGIGLILFRSTNLTRYRQASVMIIAIAIVVTALDYISSRIRRRII
jgi:phosphonate ABC transporter permease subunit PhnE